MTTWLKENCKNLIASLFLGFFWWIIPSSRSEEIRSFFLSTLFTPENVLILFIIIIIFYSIKIKKENIRLKKCLDIALFKNKFWMTPTHLRYTASKDIDNKIDITSIAIQNEICERTLSNNKDLRDTEVTMTIVATALSNIQCIILAIDGTSNVTFKDIGLKATLLNPERKLTVHAVDWDTEVKRIIINLPEINAELCFTINICWTWPNTLNATQDYISLPNFFARKIGTISLGLKPCNDLKIKKIEAYKYSISDSTPKLKLSDIKPNEKNIYTYITHNPEPNSDYILYYEAEYI